MFPEEQQLQNKKKKKIIITNNNNNDNNNNPYAIKPQHENKFFLTHYENMPIQLHVYWKLYNQKRKILKKKSDIFHIPAQNIDCGYSLEPPRRGGSNEYPQSMFFSRIRKIMYTPVNPSFTI